MNSERYPKWLKLLVAAAAAYGLLPLDLIPDVVPVVGLLDDATLLLVVGVLLVSRFLAKPRLIPQRAPIRRN